MRASTSTNPNTNPTKDYLAERTVGLPSPDRPKHLTYVHDPLYLQGRVGTAWRLRRHLVRHWDRLPEEAPTTLRVGDVLLLVEPEPHGGTSAHLLSVCLEEHDYDRPQAILRPVTGAIHWHGPDRPPGEEFASQVRRLRRVLAWSRVQAPPDPGTAAPQVRHLLRRAALEGLSLSPREIVECLILPWETVVRALQGLVGEPGVRVGYPLAA